MKSLLTYIIEGESRSDKTDKKNEKKKDKEKIRDIKFTIWKEPKVKVKWLEDGDYSYQKIEYKYITKDISICFLLGYVESEKTWKLWIGKVGIVSYDDDPYCDFETPKFSEAIIQSLEKISEFIKTVEEDDPMNWVQYYIKY